MHTIRIKVYLLAALVLVASFGARATLTIEITQGVNSALPIAVVPFDSKGLSSPLPVDLAEIVSSDLNRSGVLKAMEASVGLALPQDAIITLSK